jgi:cytidylate kinase
MTIWTVSAQAGTPGRAVATELAARAGVPLLDRAALVARAHALDPEVGVDEDIEARLGGRLNALALGAALTAGSREACRELQLRHALPELARQVMGEVARHPAVVLATAAFVPLREHPGAVHVRLQAPRDWRVAAYARAEVVDRRRAGHAIDHEDHVQRDLVRKLFHVDIDDASLFSIVVDASRFSAARIADVLLAAAAAASELYAASS